MQADAEHLPFDDASFDVVMSSIGVMFAPHHQDAADELVRVCRPGGTIGLLSWTPEGMIGGAVPHDGPVRPAAPARRLAAAAVGQRGARARAVRRPGDFRTLERDTLEVTAFERPHDFGEHFKARYGPTIAARANARAQRRARQFDAALDRFCDDWNRGTAEQARFELDYLVAVGTRAA